MKKREHAVPPALDSLIPLVNGLFAPAENRPELAQEVPESIPGAKTSLLYLPSGWQVGFTSLATTVDVKPLPPIPIHSSGTSSMVALWAKFIVFETALLVDFWKAACILTCHSGVIS